MTYRLAKWIIPVTQSEKMAINRIFTESETTDAHFLILWYIDKIRPYIYQIEKISSFEPDCYASSIVFFYGCILYTLHHPNWQNHIDAVVKYNVLYILVDHYIDNNADMDVVKEMHQLVADPYHHEPTDSILQVIVDVYRQLLKDYPHIQSLIIKLFAAEYTSSLVQKSSCHTEKTYQNIAHLKGGLTMEVMNAIVSGPRNSDSFDLGIIMQLLDDCLDVQSDTSKGINTIATYHLNRYDNLDLLWCNIAQRILRLPSKYTLFKIVYSYFAFYVPDRIPGFTSYLQSLTSDHNIFAIDASDILTTSIKQVVS